MNKLLCGAAAALLAAAPAFAANTVIDFEGPASFASVGNYYAAQGVIFGGDALALRNDELGPYFSHAPSPIGVMAPVGDDATMNVADGFLAVSFYYSASEEVHGGVRAWSGLNGTGTLLASFNLAENAEIGCDDSAYCHFDVLSRSFGSTAHSLTFGGAAYVSAFDNVSITPVPEPSTAALLAAGLGCCVVLARRTRG